MPEKLIPKNKSSLGAKVLPRRFDGKGVSGESGPDKRVRGSAGSHQLHNRTMGKRSKLQNIPPGPKIVPWVGGLRAQNSLQKIEADVLNMHLSISLLYSKNIHTLYTHTTFFWMGNNIPDHFCTTIFQLQPFPCHKKDRSKNMFHFLWIQYFVTWITYSLHVPSYLASL